MCQLAQPLPVRVKVDTSSLLEALCFLRKPFLTESLARNQRISFQNCPTDKYKAVPRKIDPAEFEYGHENAMSTA